MEVLQLRTNTTLTGTSTGAGATGAVTSSDPAAESEVLGDSLQAQCSLHPTDSHGGFGKTGLARRRTNSEERALKLAEKEVEGVDALEHITKAPSLTVCIMRTFMYTSSLITNFCTVILLSVPHIL